MAAVLLHLYLEAAQQLCPKRLRRRWYAFRRLTSNFAPCFVDVHWMSLLPLQHIHACEMKSPWNHGLLARPLLFFLLLAFLHPCTAVTDPIEVIALGAIKRDIGDVFNRLNNWVGKDPCGTGWTGVNCSMLNGTSHVVELFLPSMNFTGFLAPDIGNLTELVYLNVMRNSLTGSIPPEVGNLSKLYALLLNGNNLTGELPSELGNLAQLNRLQIDRNQISGQIPSSLQFLKRAQHFHMHINSLNGTIPPEFGQLESLIHLSLDDNNLIGEVPSEITNISTLLFVQLDNNQLTGSIPSNLSKLVNLRKLSLRNCNLTGEIPDLSALQMLIYLDLSNNRLSGTLPASISPKMTTIDLSYNNLNGSLPDAFYDIQTLELLTLRNNSLSGNVYANRLTHSAFQPSSSLVMDFQDNEFTGFTLGPLLRLPSVTLRLFGNPVCNDSSTDQSYCEPQNGVTTNLSQSTSTSVSASCSEQYTCDAAHNEELVYGLLVMGTCFCAYPLSVVYRLQSPGFTDFAPHKNDFQMYLSSKLNLLEYQVNISSYAFQPWPRITVNLKLFPNSASHQFTDSEVEHLYESFANWKILDNDFFGPYELIYFIKNFPYNGTVTGAGSSSSLSGGAIAGILVGAVSLTAIIVVVSMAFFSRRQRRSAAQVRRHIVWRHYERIKVAGVKDFTFKEMAEATNNFDEAMQIGHGGYGKVYRGHLADGVMVAIKRAQGDSLQGAKEFYTEIELLSRLHHRNLVTLIGFCDDKSEQMLVYEFMENGDLREHLNASSKQALGFPMRLQIAIGAAKGILYLHTEANPPIFHRDIKANNVLLDGKMKAKVSDFGISKLAPLSEMEGDAGGDVFITDIKGTPGYLDPEYYLTYQLTDKSDVYSFGVVLLELITGMLPIFDGKNLVREVNLSYKDGKALSFVDSRMGSYPSECLQPLLQLALVCCNDNKDDRPSMGEVVRELERIWRMSPMGYARTSFETSIDSEMRAVKYHMSFSSDNPFVSSDLDGSGTIPLVAPR